MSLFLGAVLILFSVEKPLSQCAVDTGKIRALKKALKRQDKVKKECHLKLVFA